MVSTPASFSARSAVADDQRETAITRRESRRARAAMRARVGPILPPAPRMMTSPGQASRAAVVSARGVERRLSSSGSFIQAGSGCVVSSRLTRIRLRRRVPVTPRALPNYGCVRWDNTHARYQARGLCIVPVASVSVSGSWLAASARRYICWRRVWGAGTRRVCRDRAEMRAVKYFTRAISAFGNRCLESAMGSSRLYGVPLSDLL